MIEYCLMRYVFFFFDTVIPIFFRPQELSHLGSGDSKNKTKKGSFIFSGHIPLGTCGITSMLPTSEARRDPGLVFLL
jgi:hypothetical protein